MTIGERIKDFRKIRNMTQNDLADEMGVSVQAVSKWETDKSAPDISLLAPLSTVLDVSTDTLLGKTECGFDEMKKIVNKIYQNLNGKKQAELDLDYYKTVMEYFKKYPYDDKITIACLYGASMLINRNKQGELNSSKEELNGFFRVAEKSTERIMKSDLTMFQKCEAQCTFAQTCSLMGYEERAKREIDKYAEDGWFRAKIENMVADIKTGTLEELQERFRCQRAVTSYDIETLLTSLIFSIRKMESLGDAYAEETIETGKKILKVFDSFEGLLYEPHRIYERLSVMRCLGTEYVVLGDTESALNLLEEIADYSEKVIELVKCKKETALFDASEFCGWDFSEWKENEDGFRERLSWVTTFWDIYDDKETNPIVTSPRYKAVMKRIRGGNV